MNNCNNCKDLASKHHHNHSEGNAIYGIGVIGALFYFLQGANSFNTIIIGIGKAIFWPAIVLFKLLGLLHL